MTGQQRPRGVGTLLSGYRASTPRDLNSFPSPRAILERFDVLQTLLDISALVFIALFLCLTAISVPVALFFLFFVAT